MAPPFSRPAVLFVKLILLGLVVAVGTWIALARWTMTPRNVTYAPVAQPIPFSHKHHVADDGIDCRYCHTAVENSATAGMPSSSDRRSAASGVFAAEIAVVKVSRCART